MKNTTRVLFRHLPSLRFGTLALFGALLLSPLASAGERESREPAETYRQVCAHCHAPDKAVGPVITNAFPEAAQESWGTYIDLTVRNGRAAMPAFRHSEISDRELEALSQALARGELADPDADEE